MVEINFYCEVQIFDIDVYFGGVFVIDDIGVVD